jgi:hypothetical protein
MVQPEQTEGFAMGQAIAVRTDYMSDEVRQLAKRAKDASQARRLLAITVVLDGASREESGEDAAGLGDPVQRKGAGRAR